MTALAEQPTRPGWHSCADCPSCDGTSDRHCSWSAYCGDVGHQDAACLHEVVRNAS